MNFSHQYTKLGLKIFPTIRSVNYMTKHHILLGKLEPIYVQKQARGNATLFAFEDHLITDIPLAFLQYDAAPHLICSHQAFIDLLNSFLPAGWGHNCLTTVKRVLWWQWEDER